MTASPLLLHHADEMAFLVDGQVVATGTHDELVAGHPAYRSTVLRGDAEAAAAGSTTGTTTTGTTAKDRR
ncbi:hypothetical protein [Serinicoccus marinus]|uniref:hypothetical protein n=1 Tax=Serinicoccus marinus TaxID=247333 RepID=UPI001EE95B5F|nr:hypothetical protein [Serinicoccus marinus]